MTSFTIGIVAFVVWFVGGGLGSVLLSIGVVLLSIGGGIISVDGGGAGE